MPNEFQAKVARLASAVQGSQDGVERFVSELERQKAEAEKAARYLREATEVVGQLQFEVGRLSSVLSESFWRAEAIAAGLRALVSVYKKGVDV